MANDPSNNIDISESVSPHESNPFPDISDQELRKLRNLSYALHRRFSNVTAAPSSLLQDATLSALVWAKGRKVTKDHLLNAIGTALRHRLLDKARKKKTAKHGNGLEKVELDEGLVAGPTNGMSLDDLIDMSRALDEIAEVNPRLKLSYELVRIAGFTAEEAAEKIGVGPRMVQRYLKFFDTWIAARAKKSKGNET